MPRRLLCGVCTLFAALSVVCSVGASPSVDLFISPTGDDSNDGSFAHPFRSIGRAQSEVRVRKISAQLPINVFLRAGRYELLDTLEFTPQDAGGDPKTTVTYQAYCDGTLEKSLISVEPYPYKSHLPTPPRLLWNGNGNKSDWRGPMDPFLEMNINRTNNSLLASALPLPPPVPTMDIGDVCVDEVVNGGPSGSNSGGHTCYSGSIATCVSGCMTSCDLHIERRTYSTEFYSKFSHLFGKKLEKEEDCVEVCSLSCRGCEKVIISGAKRIDPGQLSWSVYKTVTLSGGTSASIFQANLTAFLPASPTPADNPTLFSTLYVNDVQLPRAGFPNCLVSPDVSKSQTEFVCAYSIPKVSKKRNSVVYNTATFSSRATQWTNIPLAEIEVLPEAAPSLANLRYQLKTVDTSTGEIALGAGGSQLTVDTFFRGLDFTSPVAAANARFRVENILEELDSPGEWYFHPQTKMLYLLPVSSNLSLESMSGQTLEIPLLRQLVRVSGSRENVYTAAAHASSLLVETDSTVVASNLVFRQIIFSGTQLLTADVYEQIPGPSAPSPSWPMARSGALFMESVVNTTVEYCVFEKIGGNAVVISGESDYVLVHHNNISYVGSSGVAVLARTGSRRNSFGHSVLAHQLYSRFTNISSNQIHHFGRRVTHSSAIMVVGATQTTISGNLIFAFPPNIARNYWVLNSDGSRTSDKKTPGLFRGLDTVIYIQQTLANNLSTAYITPVSVASPGFDVPVVAKLIGAPECPSGFGRIGSLYGEQAPFTYTQCSGCCSVHANSAKIRIAGSGVTWSDAISREVVLRPGESLELQATSSPFFNSITDVYLGFHVVTPNQIMELPSVRAKWTILTRQCQYSEQTYAATCFGPCASSTTSPPASTGCGNSNIAVQMSRGGSFRCKPGFEPDVYSVVCNGPFEAVVDCEGNGTVKSHIYYNCSMNCFATSCT